jgi:hypothetical protein
MKQENAKNPFPSFDFEEKQLLYQGLVCLVRNNTGYGFVNNDQRHPAYEIGRKGDYDYENWGDSPEDNSLFKMMHTLSVSLSKAEIDESSEIQDYIFCWADFCSMAYEAYEKSKES